MWVQAVVPLITLLTLCIQVRRLSIEIGLLLFQLSGKKHQVKAFVVVHTT